MLNWWKDPKALKRLYAQARRLIASHEDFSLMQVYRLLTMPNMRDAQHREMLNRKKAMSYRKAYTSNNRERLNAYRRARYQIQAYGNEEAMRAYKAKYAR